MFSNTRMIRVNELLKRELAQIFERLIAHDIKALLTITQVDTAPNLRNAIVYVSIMGADKDGISDIFKKLISFRTEMQYQINKNTHLKFTPKLDFRLDETIQKGDKILDIINKLDI